MNSFAFSSPFLHGGRLLSQRRVTEPAAARRIMPRAAERRVRREENVPGDIYVDSSCIDCDTCRWLSPSIFARKNGQSYVHTQSDDLHAAAAAAACPTASIHSASSRGLAARGSSQFPMRASDLHSSEDLDDVYYLGMTNHATYGASSWLVLTPSGAIMFDVPRYSAALCERVRSLAGDAGVRYIVLSHRDDVASHEKWAEALDARRVIHVNEANSAQGTDDCEIQLTDTDLPMELEGGCTLYHAPGHTDGSIVMLHKASKSLFTGDHLMVSGDRGELMPSTTYIYYSWETQSTSVRMLADLPFLHGWPGHGRHFHFADDEEKRRAVLQTADTMQNMQVTVGAQW